MTALLAIVRNIVIILLPSLLLLWLWHRADRQDGKPALSLRAALSGVIAVPVALLAGWGVLAILEAAGLANAGDGALWMTNGLLGGRGPAGAGAAAGNNAAAVTRSGILSRAFLVAGLVEEAAKLGLVLILLRPFVLGTADAGNGTPRLVLRHGAAAGLGFGVVEAAVQLLGPAGEVLLRVLLVVPLHAALTGLLFVAVGSAVRRAQRRAARGEQRRGRRRLWLGVAIGLVPASLVHGAYNIAANTVVIAGAMVVAATLIAAIIANGIVVTENGADKA